MLTAKASNALLLPDLDLPPNPFPLLFSDYLEQDGSGTQVACRTSRDTASLILLRYATVLPLASACVGPSLALARDCWRAQAASCGPADALGIVVWARPQCLLPLQPLRPSPDLSSYPAQCQSASSPVWPMPALRLKTPARPGSQGMPSGLGRILGLLQARPCPPGHVCPAAWPEARQLPAEP